MQEVFYILYAKSSYGSSIVKLACSLLVDVGDLFVLVTAKYMMFLPSSAFLRALIDLHHNEEKVWRASLTAFVRNSNELLLI